MKRKIDYMLLLYLLIFFIISILSINSSSTLLGYNIFYKQIIWYIIGFIFMLFIYFFNIDFFYKNSFKIYLLSIILLITPLLLGDSINGSKCWINIFGFSFQPSEFMKISLIILYSSIVSKYKFISLKNELFYLLKLFIIFLIPSILTFLEPDTGSIIIYFIIFITSILFSNIKSIWYLYFFIILFLFILLLYFNKELLFNLLGSNIYYRIDRIFNWANQSGYQLESSLISIGSSGLIGNGYMNNLIYYPEANTDFIFSVFSSNYGFIGVYFYIFILLLFITYLLNICINLNKKKYLLFYLFFIFIFLYQCIQNIGMTIGLLPIIGITLPFISYGGSSVISYFILMGFLLKIKEVDYSTS